MEEDWENNDSNT